MCKVEGICLDCEDLESCPMLLVHKSFSGTLKSIMCIAYKSATLASATKYSSDIQSSAELIGAKSGVRD
jgi:hypothetical protein